MFFRSWSKKSSANVRVWLLTSVACLVISPLKAADPVADFLRFRRTASASAQLETSIRRYRHPDSGQLLSLVGAVHIGEKSYYQQIQEELDRHDLVLYEMVGGPASGSPEAPEKPPRGSDSAERRPSLDIISTLQRGMQEMLQLQHQMEHIDYTRGNLRHADLTSEEFSVALREHGLFHIDPAGLMSGIAPALIDSFSLQAAMASQDENTVNRIRWVLAKTISESVQQMALLGVKDIEKPEDLILGIRNDQLWMDFQNSLPEGWRRSAIFYGAAHLPDIRRRLLLDGWVEVDRVWVPAWKIPFVEVEVQVEVERSAQL